MEKLVIRPSAENMPQVIDFVEAYLGGNGIPLQTAMKVSVAVDEIISNIVQYSGAGEAEVCCDVSDESITLVFTDDGMPYDPTLRSDPDTSLPAEERSVGGLGIFMVKKTMDEVTYEYRDGKNILTVRKNRHTVNTYRLTTAQLNIHSRELLLPGTDVNQLYFVIRIKEELDVSCMEEAVRYFIQTNRGPRTRITLDGQEPVQYFQDETAAEIACVDLRAYEEEELEETFCAWGQEPFTYYKGRLWDFRILRLPGGEWGLYCKFHHIWCDGWSTGLIWSEILTNYCRRKEGRELIGRGADRLLDVIEKQSAYQGGREEKEDVLYYGHRLAQALKEGRRGKNPGSYGAKRSPDFPVPKQVQEMLPKFCGTYALTPYTVFMAALAVYCGGVQDTVKPVLGTARLNRDSEAERETVAECVLEIPLVADLSDQPSFSKLCVRILKESREAALHKRCGMRKIMDWLHREGGFQGDLTPYALSFQREKIDIGGYRLPLSVWFGQPATALEYILIHVLDLLEDGYRVFYDYRTSYYTAQDVGAFHEALMSIMEQGMREDPPVCALPLAGAQECERLRSPQNERAAKNKEQTLPGLFGRWVRETPDTCAVEAKDGSYTYEELDRAATRIVIYLEEQELQTEELVGILLPRTREVPAAILGIARAGGAFVLMDQAYPKERIHSILRDGRIRFVLTDENGQQLLGDGCTAILPEDLAKEEAARQKECREGRGIDPTEMSEDRSAPPQLCYAVYTSGSTGEPKGVLIEHRSICHILDPEHSQIVREIKEAEGAALVMGAFSFDISLFELFTSMLNGVTAVIASEEETKSPKALAGLLEKRAIRVICGTPSRLLAYCADPDFRRGARKLQVILSAGEAFAKGLYGELHKAAPRAHIYNGYGPTEAAIATSFARITGEETVTIGVPMAGYKLRSFDRVGRLIPYKEMGELYIGGPGLARGYSKEELTEKNFVTVEQERYYRSGDLVIRQRNDEFLFAGRKDEQVKLRGFRIELQEIEAVLCGCPGIREAAAVVKKAGNSELLCAFYAGESTLPDADLKRYAAKFLPHYMVPSVLIHLPALPVTRNGKVDKHGLLEREVILPYAPPETPLQKTLTEIVEKVLDLKRAGMDDNFFEIGGNSLNVAMYAVEALARGIEFEYESLYRYPTVREFSDYLEHTKAAAAEKTDVGVYDYRAIDRYLKEQKPEVHQARKGQTVLLTGATGYLGGHILYELLKSTDAVIYCMVRAGRQTPLKRLNGRFFYYFEQGIYDFGEDRVHVAEGDLTAAGFSEGLAGVRPDLVINCAADVAHYSFDSGMRQLNTDSLAEMIDFCEKTDAKLVQISTVSVGQFGTGKEFESRVFDERDLYIGQDLSNAYLKSKFLAERMILEAAAGGRIRAQILRVGNLQARYGDAEFQMNYRTNAFSSRLRGFAGLGFVSEELAKRPVDYSPVDYVAKAVCLLARQADGQTVFHVLNDKGVPYGMFFQAIEECGYPLKRLKGAAYEARLKEAFLDDTKKELLAEIVSDLAGHSGERCELDISGRITTEVLRQLAFEWPVIGREHLKSYIHNLDDLGYFKEKDGEEVEV